MSGKWAVQMSPSRRLRLLLGGGAAVAGIVAVAAAAFPSLVYDRFLWRYLVGPIVADAANQATATFHGVVAHRGYNIVNEVVYGATLLYGIGVVVELLRSREVGGQRNFVLWFIPFIVFGGLLRVVEDASILQGAARYLLISPVIYGTVFVLAGASLAAGIALERRGLVSDYRTVIAGAGTVGAVLAAALLATQPVRAGWMLPAGLGLAAVLAAVTVGAVRAGKRRWSRLAPVDTAEGRAVIGGHMLDGAATALSIAVLGYGEKHPVTAFVMEAAGTPYAFPAVKAVVIVGLLAVLGGADRDEDPLFYNLVLLGVLAVGLGPGVRNLTRAVLGV
ncbi:MAG: DUF63 family protein [Candidatus Nanohaloarchaea archaeon]